MSVGRVQLVNFRNYEGLDLNLTSGLTLVQGSNGQGKTNFLEALYLVSRAQLLRGMRDAEAVLEGKPSAEVKVQLKPGGTEVQVTLQPGTKKRVFVNGMALPRASDILGRVPSVSVSSADLPIIAGEPSDRRFFLDLELSGLYPSYLRDLTHYKRALEQRNALLKRAQEFSVDSNLFESWEDQLAIHGANLRRARVAFLALLAPLAKETQSHLGQGEDFNVAYAQKDPSDEEMALRAAYALNRPHDVARGQTTIGPHRDDVRIEVDGREARLYGSQGQQRSAMISLKLATLRTARTVLGDPPLLLLDDVFSDLDARRRANLVDWVLSNAAQTVLTCTEAEAAGEILVAQADLVHCEDGKLTR